MKAAVYRTYGQPEVIQLEARHAAIARRTSGALHSFYIVNENIAMR